MEEQLFSTSRAAQILDVSTATLKRWYKWYESNEFEKPIELKLPEYTTDNRGTKFFSMEAVQELCVFRDKLQNEYKGIMADFNAHYQWGNRGKDIQARKEKKRNAKNYNIKNAH